MATQLARVLFSSALAIAAAAGVWLLVRGGEAGDAGTSTARDPAAEQTATGPAATLAAQGPEAGNRTAPTPSGARTALASPPAPSTGHRLFGRLLTVDRAPAADVEIGLDEMADVEMAGLPVALPRPPGRGAPTATTRSAADGRFELRASAGQESTLRLLDETWYVRGDAEKPALAELRVAALTADRDLGDIVLGRCARVAGVVQNEVGKPVAGVRVSVGSGREGVLFAGLGGSNLVTGDDGRFARAGLLPGRYTISTASPDFLPARQPIELQDGEVRDDVVVALRAGNTIAGVVVDDRGTPVPGMKVAADRAREVSPGLQVQSSSPSEAATTDASGRFVLHGLETATVNVEAWGPGHARGRVGNVAAGTTDVVLKLERHGRVTGRVVDAAGAPVVGTRVAAQPVVGRPGALFREGEDGTESGADGGFVLDRVRPGATTIVAEGKDHLRVESAAIDVQAGQVTEGVQLVVQRGAALVVKVTDAAGKPVAGARVTVADAPTGGAPSGTGRAMRFQRRVSRDGGGDVRFGDAREHGQATTDAHGVARVGGLPAGAVVARVAHERFAPTTGAPVTMPNAGEVETELSVVAGGFVQLQALDDSRAPLASAHYKLLGPFGTDAEPRAETGICDGKGLATVGPLPPGRWKARLRLAPRPMDLGEGMSMMLFGNDGHEFAETETLVDVVAEQTAAVTLTRPQLTALRGTVSDTEGLVPGAKVKLAAASDIPGLGGGYSATTDGSGAFKIEDVPAGKYTLRYGYPDAIAMSEESLEIVAGQALIERALTLRTGTLKLIVRGEDGEAVARARVTLDRSERRQGQPRTERREMRMVAIARNDSGGGSETTSITAGNPSAMTDAEGEVEITRVPEGAYTLRIEHPQHVEATKPDVKVLDGATLDLGTITMAIGGELRGRVLGADGKAVDFAHVELTPLPNGASRMETAINGSFRVTGLAAGKYRVRGETMAGAPGGDAARASEPIEVELDKGERRSLDLQVK